MFSHLRRDYRLIYADPPWRFERNKLELETYGSLAVRRGAYPDKFEPPAASGQRC